MTSIEDRLRDLGRTVGAPTLPGATAVMRRGRQRRRKRRGRLAAAGLVVAGTGAGLAGRALQPDGAPTLRTSAADDGSGAPATTTSTTPYASGPCRAPDGTTPCAVLVPDVIGLGVDQARDVLEQAGFAAEMAGDLPGDARVLAQSPAAGATILAGSTIRLEVG